MTSIAIETRDFHFGSLARCRALCGNLAFERASHGGDWQRAAHESRRVGARLGDTRVRRSTLVVESRRPGLPLAPVLSIVAVGAAIRSAKRAASADLDRDGT